MYAITFDLSIAQLEQHYPNKSYQNACGDIEKFLSFYGFARQRGSVYFGNENTDAVKTVIAVTAMSAEFDWLKKCVTDIRMLRIEENNDLSIALQIK